MAPPPDFATLPRDDRPFLLEPLSGYPLVVDPTVADELRSAWTELARGADPGAVRSVAERLLAGDPGLHAARHLAAAAAFVAGDLRGAAESLRPVLAELPDYLAAGLLFARAAERTDDPLGAFETYLGLARADAADPHRALAARRAAELASRAREVTENRLNDALARGRVDLAEAELARLSRWAPGDATTLRASADVAAARGDTAAELVAVAQLAALSPGDEAIAERWGDLELAVGDPARGLAVFERLAGQHPDDTRLAGKREAAKFSWRLEQLPERVKRAGRAAALTRGDYAVLLYWLVPGVRYGRPTSARIATDILDDPRRDEIVRVVNLGLMDIDEDLHRFAPGAGLTRRGALLAVLRALALDRGPACVGDAAALGGRVASETVCAAAARCGLLRSVPECLPQGGLSGSEALEVIRLSLTAAGDGGRPR